MAQLPALGDFRKISLRARTCGSWHESFKEVIDFDGPYKFAFQIIYHLLLELIRDSVARVGRCPNITLQHTHCSCRTLSATSSTSVNPTQHVVLASVHVIQLLLHFSDPITSTYPTSPLLSLWRQSIHAMVLMPIVSISGRCVVDSHIHWKRWFFQRHYQQTCFLWWTVVIARGIVWSLLGFPCSKAPPYCRPSTACWWVRMAFYVY